MVPFQSATKMVGKLAGFLALTQVALLVGACTAIPVRAPDGCVCAKGATRWCCSTMWSPPCCFSSKLPRVRGLLGLLGPTLTDRLAGEDAIKKQEVVVRDRGRKAELVSQKAAQARLLAEEELRKTISLKDRLQKAGFRVQVHLFV